MLQHGGSVIGVIGQQIRKLRGYEPLSSETDFEDFWTSDKIEYYSATFDGGRHFSGREVTQM